MLRELRLMRQGHLYVCMCMFIYRFGDFQRKVFSLSKCGVSMKYCCFLLGLLKVGLLFHVKIALQVFIR